MSDEMTVLRVVGRRKSEFRGVSWSPDGSLIAAAGSDGCVWVFPVEGGDARVYQWHEAPVWDVAFSPDGRLIASGAEDGSVRVGPVSDEPGRSVRHSDGVSAICWSPEGRRFATSSRDRTVILWNIVSSDPVRKLWGFLAPITDVDWSAMGDLLAFVESGNRVHVYGMRSGERIRVFEIAAESPHGVACSPDRVIAASGGNAIYLWDTETGRRLRKLEGHSDMVYQVSWSRDGQLLASTARDRTVTIWNAKTGEPVHVLKGHAGETWGVAWSPDSKRILSGSLDTTLRIWNVRSGAEERVLHGFSAEPRSVCWSRDRSRFSISTERVRVYESDTGRVVSDFAGSDGALAQSGKRIAIISNERTVRVESVGTGDVEHDETPGYAASWAADGIALLIAADDGLKIVDAQGSPTLSSARARPDVVAGALFGEFVAIVDYRAVVLWDWRRQTDVWQSVLQTHHVVSLAWAPGGRLLAAGGRDGKVFILDASTGAVTRVLEGHSGWLGFLDWSSDGRFLASMSDDGEVRVWRVEDGVSVGNAPPVPVRRACGVLFASRAPRTLEYLDTVLRVEVVPVGVEATVVPQTVSAKVVFLGESDAGKTTLARRFEKGEFLPPGSTHGMQTIILDPSKLFKHAVTPEGEQREIVLWDFGGQRHYQLVHQAFLGDTTAAVMVFDSTRDQANFDAVREWDHRLTTRAGGRSIHKILVRSKCDMGGVVNQPELKRLREDLGSVPYLEVSAQTGAGIEDLGKEINDRIDWEDLARISRTPGYQRVHEVIARLRDQGRIIRYERDLMRDVGEEAEAREVDAVVKQLAQQGRVADVRLSSTGERVVVLRIEVVENYAGSLVLEARKMPRGVPAIEERTVANMKDFPGIAETQRVERQDERVVLDGVIDLLVHEGLCLRHAGLLVFPSEFPGNSADELANLPHRKPIYYDFTGPIDNIYASLAANLAVSGQFGSVRLWRNRAEYEETGRGLFGVYLRELRRGYGHLDLYFSDNADRERQELFLAYVDSHLREHGVTIVERLGMQCVVCKEELQEKWFRNALERGEKELACPNCRTNYPVLPTSDGEAGARPGTAERLKALKTEVERGKKVASDASKRAVERARSETGDGLIRVLHLSDLHLDGSRDVLSLLQPLNADLRALGVGRLDYVVASGDFADKCSPEGFDLAEDFLKELLTQFQVAADRLILVPGNHDLDRDLNVYAFETARPGKRAPEEFVEIESGPMKGGYLVRNNDEYPKRFERFRKLHHNLLQREYPLRHEEQGLIVRYPETGIEFLTLNTAWQIDRAFPERASINAPALARALSEARKNSARLRIAVWHHAVWAGRQIANKEQLEHLVKAGFRLCLHGDIHEETEQVVNPLLEKKLWVIGAGAFGARGAGLPEGSPRLYSLLEIDREFKKVVVRMRAQRRGAFGPHAVFGDGEESRRGWFEIEL